jgi:predicted component of type VI protein secretion system
VLFIVTVLTKLPQRAAGSWRLLHQLIWVTAAAYFVFALTGIGLLTSVPQSMVLLLGVGWIFVKRPAARAQILPVERHLELAASA